MKSTRHIAFLSRIFLLLAVFFTVFSTTVLAAPVTVTWQVDGVTVATTNVESGNKPVLPTNPTDPSTTRIFVGWTANSTYAAATAPTDLFTSSAEAPVVNAATTFHAVYANKKITAGLTATFAANNIGATPALSESSWRHTLTGITLSLVTGSRDTGSAPNTFNINIGSANYAQLVSPSNMYMTRVVATLASDVYAVDAVSSGWAVSGSSAIQTITSEGQQSLQMYAANAHQARIAQLEVTYYTLAYDNYSVNTGLCKATTTATVEPVGQGDVAIQVP